MSNLSQKKRTEMLEYLSELKKIHSDDKSIRALNAIETALTEKKYGLVWEEHSEKVNEMLVDNIPVFTEVEECKITAKEEEGYNFILEGDNLHSLKLLEKTHKGKIDVIYIDPPYNTNNSLTYNDKRIGEDDAFRHSKWLSFMSERLSIARNLLNKQGLIFISIDDNEGYNLKVLCDEIFDENNFMGSFSITKAEGGGQAKYIVKGHDLVLVYAQNLAITKPLGRSKDIRGKQFEKDGELFWIQEDAYRKVFGQYGNLHYEEILEYKGQEYKDDIDQKIANGEIVLLDKGLNGMHILGKVRKVSDDYSKFHSVMKQLNADGKTDLAAFGLESLFDYPKPVDLIKELISGAAFLRPGRLTVLDFFAGSGTTAQAVLELVKETSRDIRFILCTNNEVSAKQKLNFVKTFGYLENYIPTPSSTESAIEKKIDKELEANGISLQELINNNPELYEAHGICQSVTYKRVMKVINGFEWQKKNNKILFKQKLKENNLLSTPDYIREINDIKEKEDYENYKLRIDDSANLVLEALIKSGEYYEGIPANLKYFKTEYVKKFSEEEEIVSDRLLSHIKEMVELENMCQMDGMNHMLVLSEEELESLDVNTIKEHAKVYIPSFVLLSRAQENAFTAKEINVIQIPDYYFLDELREVGEL